MKKQKYAYCEEINMNFKNENNRRSKEINKI
jgi:hypothetical protein